MGVESPQQREPGVIYEEEFEAWIDNEMRIKRSRMSREVFREMVLDNRGLMMARGRIFYVGPDNRRDLKSGEYDAVPFTLTSGKEIYLELSDDPVRQKIMEEMYVLGKRIKELRSGDGSDGLPEYQHDEVRERMLHEAEEARLEKEQKWREAGLLPPETTDHPLLTHDQIMDRTYGEMTSGDSSLYPRGPFDEPESWIWPFDRPPDYGSGE